MKEWRSRALEVFKSSRETKTRIQISTTKKVDGNYLNPEIYGPAFSGKRTIWLRCVPSLYESNGGYRAQWNTGFLEEEASQLGFDEWIEMRLICSYIQPAFADPLIVLVLELCAGQQRGDSLAGGCARVEEWHGGWAEGLLICTAPQQGREGWATRASDSCVFC